MVSRQEKQARIQEFFRFTKEEVLGLLSAIVVTAFIFSFRDWGVEQFNASTGVRNLLIMIFIVVITFTIRFSLQKMKALANGYKGNFKVWWSGLAAALILTFISVGKIPLVLVGTLVNTMMVKQRLGEFRYGFTHAGNAAIAAIGIYTNLALATISATGLYFLPESYIFSKALLLNLIMAACALIPLKQLDGLSIFFGHRLTYFFQLGMVIIYWILLLSKTRIGLIFAIITITLLTVAGILKTSEK